MIRAVLLYGMKIFSMPLRGKFYVGSEDLSDMDLVGELGTTASSMTSTTIHSTLIKTSKIAMVKKYQKGYCMDTRKARDPWANNGRDGKIQLTVGVPNWGRISRNRDDWKWKIGEARAPFK